MSATPSSAAGGIAASTAACAGNLGGQAVDRVDVELHDGVRVLLRHLLDLDATLGRQHQQMLLRRSVEREAGVVLLSDVGRVLDPDALHDMALDVHAEDVAGVQPNLVSVVGQLDPARLAPPADLHLGLDDDGVPGGIGGGHGFVHGVGGAAGGDRDAIAGEVLLALVLEQIHVTVSLTSVVLSVERLLEPLADALQRGARAEELGDALLLQRPYVGVGDDATAEHEHVAEIPAAQFVHHRGNNVRWAPESSERPTASTSSCSAVSAICSGVWCRPV